MNIEKLVRQALIEREAKTEKDKNHQYDYGCVMIFLNVIRKEWNKLQDEIDDDDIYLGEDDQSGGYGRETEPHCTILYGIHSDVPDQDVENIIDGIKEPKIELKDITSFKNDQFDVLKFDVKSANLNTLNKKFSELPHTTSYPDFHPHVTICYLKPGTAEKYIKLFNDKEPLDVATDKIVYSKPDGKKKNYKLKK